MLMSKHLLLSSLAVVLCVGCAGSEGGSDPAPTGAPGAGKADDPGTDSDTDGWEQFGDTDGSSGTTSFGTDGPESSSGAAETDDWATGSTGDPETSGGSTSGWGSSTGGTWNDGGSTSGWGSSTTG